MTYVIMGLIGGVICALIANHKGRNAVGWFFFGFFLPLVAVIVSLVVSNKKEERARYAKAASERRRLREQLKMERMQRQQEIGAANQRIDMHDRAIGVETAPGVAPPLLPQTQIEPPAELEAPAEEVPPPQWHYASPAGDQVGPVTFAELGSEYRAGHIGRGTLVWQPGWTEWHKIGEVDGLETALES